jgi:hypothetical protein
VIFLSRRWTIHGRGRCFSNGATDWRKLRCGKQIYVSFQSVRHPFILTPGDNDWTDCHLVKDPKIDPLDRRVAPHMSAIGGKADIEILEYCKADMKIGPDSLPT